ncbi:MAG: peptidylprolyl isomerase [Deltaproteobacteria bacterium]|jgi:peptidylprolyl isomerase
MSKVKNGDFVQLHYTGSLEDGSVFDSSEGRNPLEFQVGGGGIIQGFNDAVVDMEVNEEKKVVLSPDQAYGEPREDLKREFPTSMLEGHKVEEGQQLRFSSPHGPVSGTVLSIEPEKFKVDFNHPLAGQTLHFNIKIVGISDTPTQQQAGCSCTPSSCSSGCDSCS